MKLGKYCFGFLFLVITLISCEKEKEYVYGEPIDFVSWLDNIDSNFCVGDFKLDDNTDKVLGRSNFEILGSDTQFAFIVKVPKSSTSNPKGINFLGFKLNNSKLNVQLDSNSFDGKILQLSSLQFNSSETQITPINFVISSAGEDYFEFNGKLKVIYSSTFALEDSFVMEFKNIKIEKSYVRVWVNGSAVQPINWDIDLKSGNEYFPEPTIAIIPEPGKTIQMGIAMLKNKFNYPIGNGEKQFTRLRVGNKYMLPRSGEGGLNFTQFLYKDKMRCSFNATYLDSTNASNNYKIDSIKINYSRISF